MSRNSRILFIGLIAIGVIPIVVFDYIPAVDLPNHILAAVLLSGEFQGSSPCLISTEWLTAPYILFHLLMYPFIKLVGFTIAAKIVVGLYVILLPISVLVYVREFNRRNQELAFFSFLFIYTYHFEYGFIPYCIGIPFVFLGLAVLNKGIRKGLPMSYVAISGLIALLVYLSHFVNAAAFIIGVIFLVWTNKTVIAGYSRDKYKSYLRVACRLFYVSLPSVVCFVYYLSEVGAKHAEARGHFFSSLLAMEFDTLYHQIAGGVRVLFSSDGILDFVIIAAIGLLVIWLLMRNGIPSTKGFLVRFGIVAWALAFLLPRTQFLGGWDHSSRFAVFGIISLLMSLEIGSKGSKRAIVAAICILVLLTTGFRMQHYHRVSSLTSEYVKSAETYIPSGSKVCVIDCAFQESTFSYMLHSIAYYHLAKGGFSPHLFTDLRHVAGVTQMIDLPRLWELWTPEDTLRYSKVLPFYDNLVIITAGTDLPAPLSKFEDAVIHEDTICTIIDLKLVDFSPE
ncbi:MAG: hypothetical protein KKH67_04035 [candidate division Zixibacteria bacterium]|nr:hypothetical protein [candidate division Zixibacteria bacterium]MBU1469749.1 hypothetical protein [candidate division Zixibacteria bacterium]